MVRVAVSVTGENAKNDNKQTEYTLISEPKKQPRLIKFFSARSKVMKYNH